MALYEVFPVDTPSLVSLSKHLRSQPSDHSLDHMYLDLDACA